MKDKEKQIVEMAKVICKTVNKKELKHCEVQCNVDCLEIAKELLKHYQPKLPEDSVVLSKEEYKMLLEEARKAKNQCIKIELETIIKAEEKERKKTAEKIIDLIKTFCPDKKFIEIISHIIAERFGVKIKE